MQAPCNEIIDDIEDLISSQDITPKERYSNRKNVKVRARKKPVYDGIIKHYEQFIIFNCSFKMMHHLRKNHLLIVIFQEHKQFI